MSIEITHDYADGTLLHGTSKSDTRRGTPMRDILDLHRWRWKNRLLAWVQLSSRDKPARKARIEATAEALRELGYEVTVNVDNTPRDMDEAEADRAQRMSDRVHAFEDKAQRRLRKSDAHHRASDGPLEHIPLGQPMMPGHYSFRADRNGRERAQEHHRKSYELIKQAQLDKERAATASRHVDRRLDPVTVANRIVEMEKELRRWRDSNPSSPHVADLEHKLSYWRKVREQQIADGVAPNYGPQDVEAGGAVLIDGSWHPVFRVNEKTVSVGLFKGQSGKWMQHRYPYHRVQRVHPKPESGDWRQ